MRGTGAPNLGETSPGLRILQSTALAGTEPALTPRDEEESPSEGELSSADF